MTILRNKIKIMKDTHSGNTHHDQDYICIVEAVGKQEAKHATI